MDNSGVISKLMQCVEKLEDDIQIVTKKRDNTPSTNRTLREEKRKLTRLIAEMLAEKNSLEVVINERTAAAGGVIPALTSDQVAKFTAQMNILNGVIQADQGFDRIVAIAKGINSASAEIGKITA